MGLRRCLISKLWQQEASKMKYEGEGMNMKMRESYLVEKRVIRNREDTSRKLVSIIHILSHSDCFITKEKRRVTVTN